MSDFLNKVITLILIFVMLILAPLLLSYMSTDMSAERLVLNDVTQFIDKVTDRAAITEKDLNTLYLNVNSHGRAYEVTVKRYQVMEEPIPSGSGDEITETNLIYISMDDIEALVNGTSETGTIELNVKDVVKVHVEEVAMSPGNRMLWTLLRVDKGRFEFSLAGTVR
jgi:hypothetical protein